MLAWTFSRARYIDLACILSTNFITESRILTLSLTSKLLLTIKLTVKITLTLRNPLILTRKHEKIERQNDAISVWQMRTSIYLEKLNIDVLHIFNFELLKLKVCSAAKLSLKQGYIYITKYYLNTLWYFLKISESPQYPDIKANSPFRPWFSLSTLGNVKFGLANNTEVQQKQNGGGRTSEFCSSQFAVKGKSKCQKSSFCFIASFCCVSFIPPLPILSIVNILMLHSNWYYKFDQFIQ